MYKDPEPTTVGNAIPKPFKVIQGGKSTQSPTTEKKAPK